MSINAEAWYDAIWHAIKKLTTVALRVEDVHRMELILMHRCAICYNMNANDVYML